MPTPEIESFFDDESNTISHVVSDSATRKCAIIDSVLGYQQASGRTNTVSADRIVRYVSESQLDCVYILETHVHADHLTAAPYLKEKLGGQIAIGNHITNVQATFADVFNMRNLSSDGSEFDQLLADGDEFRIGTLKGTVMYTPGHTEACCTYVIGDAAFVGDTLFMPDYGTARCDFPGGDAGTLYDSIQKIFALPADVRLFMCHDYKAPGRDEYAWETTVSHAREANVHLRNGLSRDDYASFREARDATLAVPKLMLPSLQVNIRAGILPDLEDNGVRYLRIPLDRV